MTVAHEPSPARLAYTIPEVCQMLDISEDFFYDEAKAGRVQYVKLGNRSRVLKSQLDTWIASFRIVSGAA